MEDRKKTSWETWSVKKNRCKAQSNSRRSISVGRFWHFQFFEKLIKKLVTHIKKEHRANNNLDLIIRPPRAPWGPLDSALMNE